RSRSDSSEVDATTTRTSTTAWRTCAARKSFARAVGAEGASPRPAGAQPATSNTSGSATRRGTTGTTQGTIGPMTPAERLGAITAAVAGYEAITRLGMAASGVFHARGWHATSVCGAFGAALAAGACERLDAPRLTAALGLAGSFASGVMEHLEDGSWVKRLHPGW